MISSKVFSCKNSSRLKLSITIAVAIAFVVIITSITNLHYKESVVTLQAPLYESTGTSERESGSTTFIKTLAPSYVKAILDPKNKDFDRLQCQGLVPQRYEHVRIDRGSAEVAKGLKRYFFALNLRQCVPILPRLLGSIVEAVRFLGPENCVLSIVEGHSDDGTLEVLKALRKDFDDLGLEMYLDSSNLDSKSGDRIKVLANLRNLALEPLSNSTNKYSSDAVVVFLNDVAICAEDILELVYQHTFQKADMVCAMDWSDIEPQPIFYDIWIARTLNGDTFWQIPEDGGWRFASNLFWNHPASRQRYDERKAFQVFACWNGAVVFRAEPIMQHKIKFRGSKPDECFAGEPRLFCKDLWMGGYSKIAVVPSVNLDYSDKSAKKAKGLYGFVSDIAKAENVTDETRKIVWEERPPDQVKCMSSFEDQSWVPWNQGFEDGVVT